MVSYLELYNSNQRTKQYWFALLKNGATIECGIGYVEGEFGVETFEKMAQAVIDSGGMELQPIKDNYTFDYTTNVITAEGEKIHINEMYEMEHPDEDCFVLVPKSDIVKTWFEIRELKKAIKINATKLKDL